MASLYCECGYGIWSDLWWTEEGAEMLFLDNRKGSATYGGRVSGCPGCGRRLELEALRSEYRGTARRSANPSPAKPR